MAKVLEYKKDFDFKTKYGKNSACCMFLKKHLMVSFPTDEDGDLCRSSDIKYSQSPIMEDEENGQLMIWCKDNNMWWPIHNDIQDAYIDFIAERELLKEQPSEPKRKGNKVK